MTIRLRLTLWYSSLLIGMFILFGVAVFAILDRTLHAQVDSNLLVALDEIEADISESIMVEEDGDVVYTMSPNLEWLSTSDVYLQLWKLGETDFPYSVSLNIATHHTPLSHESLHANHEQRDIVQIDGMRMRVITRPIYVESQLVGHLQAATTLEPIDSATERLFGILVAEGLIALLISFILGNWLAMRALRPISNITQTAEQITAANDLTQRIPYDGPQDEIGHLTTTFNDMVERLESLFNAQRRFVADVSHELRTPVTAIQGHIELIERFGHDPQSITAIQSETQRMSRLIRDLLMLAQADVGHLPLNRSHVQLDTLILQCFSDAVMLSQERLQIRVDKIDQVTIEGDSDRLKQLLANLMTNALQYTPDGGEIHLRLRQHNQWAEIHVIDTGYGIPATDLPHIFDRFYRVDKARSRSAGGTGLGLSIVKWIVEAHAGEIHVESEVDHGTTVIVRLPLAPQPIHESEPSPTKRPWPKRHEH